MGMNKEEIQKQVEGIIKANSGFLWDNLHDQEKKELVDQLTILVKRAYWAKEAEKDQSFGRSMVEIIAYFIRKFGKNGQIKIPYSHFVTLPLNIRLEHRQVLATGDLIFTVSSLQERKR